MRRLCARFCTTLLLVHHSKQQWRMSASSSAPRLTNEYPQFDDYKPFDREISSVSVRKPLNHYHDLVITVNKALEKFHFTLSEEVRPTSTTNSENLWDEEIAKAAIALEEVNQAFHQLASVTGHIPSDRLLIDVIHANASLPPAAASMGAVNVVANVIALLQLMASEQRVDSRKALAEAVALTLQSHIIPHLTQMVPEPRVFLLQRKLLQELSGANHPCQYLDLSQPHAKLFHKTGGTIREDPSVEKLAASAAAVAVGDDPYLAEAAADAETEELFTVGNQSAAARRKAVLRQRMLDDVLRVILQACTQIGVVPLAPEKILIDSSFLRNMLVGRPGPSASKYQDVDSKKEDDIGKIVVGTTARAQRSANQPPTMIRSSTSAMQPPSESEVKLEVTHRCVELLTCLTTFAEAFALLADTHSLCTLARSATVVLQVAAQHNIHISSLVDQQQSSGAAGQRSGMDLRAAADEAFTAIFYGLAVSKCLPPSVRPYQRGKSIEKQKEELKSFSIHIQKDLFDNLFQGTGVKSSSETNASENSLFEVCQRCFPRAAAYIQLFLSENPQHSQQVNKEPKTPNLAQSVLTDRECQLRLILQPLLLFPTKAITCVSNLNESEAGNDGEQGQHSHTDDETEADTVKVEESLLHTARDYLLDFVKGQTSDASFNSATSEQTEFALEGDRLLSIVLAATLRFSSLQLSSSQHESAQFSATFLDQPAAAFATAHRLFLSEENIVKTCLGPRSREVWVSACVEAAEGALVAHKEKVALEDTPAAMVEEQDSGTPKEENATSAAATSENAATETEDSPTTELATQEAGEKSPAPVESPSIPAAPITPLDFYRHSTTLPLPTRIALCKISQVVLGVPSFESLQEKAAEQQVEEALTSKENSTEQVVPQEDSLFDGMFDSANGYSQLLRLYSLLSVPEADMMDLLDFIAKAPIGRLLGNEDTHGRGDAAEPQKFTSSKLDQALVAEDIKRVTIMSEIDPWVFAQVMRLASRRGEAKLCLKLRQLRSEIHRAPPPCGPASVVNGNLW